VTSFLETWYSVKTSASTKPGYLGRHELGRIQTRGLKGSNTKAGPDPKESPSAADD